MAVRDRGGIGFLAAFVLTLEKIATLADPAYVHLHSEPDRRLRLGTTFGVVFVHWLIFSSLYDVAALCPYCIAVWIVTPIFCTPRCTISLVII